MSIGKIREKNLFKNIKDEIQIMKTFDESNDQRERNFNSEPPIVKPVFNPNRKRRRLSKAILIKKLSRKNFKRTSTLKMKRKCAN